MLPLGDNEPVLFVCNAPVIAMLLLATKLPPLSVANNDVSELLDVTLSVPLEMVAPMPVKATLMPPPPATQSNSYDGLKPSVALSLLNTT